MRVPWSIAAEQGASEPYDVVRARAHELLRQCCAADVAHLGDDLLSHLERTEAILRDWAVDDVVALAGLCHAAYGTDGFAPSLLPLTERAQLAAAIGNDAEAVVYLYACCDRSAVYPQLGRADIDFRDRFTHEGWRPDVTSLAGFAELTAANELELIRSGVFTDRAAITQLSKLFERLATYSPARVGIAVEEATAALANTA